MNLSHTQCKRLIDLAESKNKWDRIRGGSKTSYRTSIIELQDRDVINRIEEYCKDRLKLNKVCSKIAIIKYLPGDNIQRHIDAGTDFEDKSDFVSSAVYNINIRLNDEFEGGDFFLDDKLYAKPVGKIYHYDSDVYHEVKVVTKGVRYIALVTISQSDIMKETKVLNSII